MSDTYGKIRVMPCPIPDRNARPMQDPEEFKQVVESRRHEVARKRLQELAEQIPPGYGAGDDLDKAKAECDRLRMDLAEAREEASRIGAVYAQHISLMAEERRILSDLGLHANLYRPDSQ